MVFPVEAVVYVHAEILECGRGLNDVAIDGDVGDVCSVKSLG